MKAAHGSTALLFASAEYHAMFPPSTAVCNIGLAVPFALCVHPAGVAACFNHREPS
jgi:hypothetical protein